MKFHVYQDLKGEWRWRLVADNGRIMADSAEGYVSESNVCRAISTLITTLLIDQDIEVVKE